LDITDIPGARAKKDWRGEAKTKPTNKIDDIPGTKAHPRHQARQNSAGFTTYDYRDVTKPHFTTTRIGGDPLNPTYVIRDEEGKGTTVIGEIKGNKPQVLPPKRERGDVSPFVFIVYPSWFTSFCFQVFQRDGRLSYKSRSELLQLNYKDLNIQEILQDQFIDQRHVP
jgi:hypothetical protein